MAKPDFCYDPEDWEATYEWGDRELLTEDMHEGDFMRVSTLIIGPDKFVVCIKGEDGALDRVWFDSEAEAQEALKRAQNEEIGRFGHHPDPAIDFFIEVERIEGMVRAGLSNEADLRTRLDRAMEFRVGGELHCIGGKTRLREIDAQLRGE